LSSYSDPTGSSTAVFQRVSSPSCSHCFCSMAKRKINKRGALRGKLTAEKRSLSRPSVRSGQLQSLVLYNRPAHRFSDSRGATSLCFVLFEVGSRSRFSDQSSLPIGADRCRSSRDVALRAPHAAWCTKAAHIAHKQATWRVNGRRNKIIFFNVRRYSTREGVRSNPL